MRDMVALNGKEPNMTTDNNTNQEKIHKIRMVIGVLIAIVSIMGIATQGNKGGTSTPAVVSAMTATTQGQVTDVSGDVGHRIYEVAFTDSTRNRHTVTTIANSDDEYSKGDFVEVSYDPSNPDGGCKIKRATVKIDRLIEQAEGTDPSKNDSSNSSSSSKPTIAQRWLEQELDDTSEDRDALSEINRISREQYAPRRTETR